MLTKTKQIKNVVRCVYHLIWLQNLFRDQAEHLHTMCSLEYISIELLSYLSFAKRANAAPHTRQIGTYTRETAHTNWLSRCHRDLRRTSTFQRGGCAYNLTCKCLRCTCTRGDPRLHKFIAAIPSAMLNWNALKPAIRNTNCQLTTFLCKTTYFFATFFRNSVVKLLRSAR